MVKVLDIGIYFGLCLGLLMLILFIIGELFNQYIFISNRKNGIILKNKNEVISYENFNGSYLNNSIIARELKIGKLSTPSVYIPSIVFSSLNGKFIRLLNNQKSNFEICPTFTRTTGYNWDEDPRIFKTNSEKYPYIISWLEVKHPLDFKLYASLLDKNEKFVYKVALQLPWKKNSLEKNWILLNSKNLEDTHWARWYYPKHEVVRINMFTGIIKEGWKTETIKKAKNFRGGTNLINHEDFLYGFAHVRNYFPINIKPTLIKISNSPPYKILDAYQIFLEEINNKCIYPTGLKEDNNNIKLLAGIDDIKLMEITMSKNEILHTLKSV